MKAAAWKGNWWLANDQATALPGTLHDDGNGIMRLELIGGFTDRDDDPTISGPSHGHFPIIHGLCGGELFTLVGCQILQAASSLLGAISDQTIDVITALRGVIIQDANEEVFTQLDVQIEYLLAWSTMSSMSSSILVDEGGRWTGEQTATSKPTEDLTASYEGQVFTLRVPHTTFRFATAGTPNRRTIESHEFAEISIRSAMTSSLASLASTSKALQDLVTLAAYSPAAIVKRTLWCERKSDIDGKALSDRMHEVEVLGRMVYRPESIPKAEPYQFLFTLADVSFAEITPAWLTLYETASLPAGVLFGTQYQTSGYTGTHLFLVASAAEGLHRALHDSPAVSVDDFELARTMILRTLSGEKFKPARKLAHERFHNDMTFAQRMSELCNLVDEGVVQTLLTDRERWIQLLKAGRNGTAHADHSRDEQHANVVTPFRLTRVTYAFLCVVLMAELGIRQEVQRSAIEIPDVAFAIEAFREVV